MSKKKKQVLKSESEELPGISLEKTVVRIQQMMDPDSTVTHNEKIIDRVGLKRQFDVVIRGTFGGRTVLGVIECKDHSRKKGLDQIEAFAKKTENLNANLKLMVSKKGFTKQALVLATHEGIGCLSLLHADPEVSGFRFGDMWYGRLYSWATESMTISFTNSQTSFPRVDINTVKYDDKPVLLWFLREFYTTYNDDMTMGSTKITTTFSHPIVIEIEGADYEVNAIAVVANRVCIKKRKWMNWSGEGFFDWHKSEVTIPAQGTLFANVNMNLISWEDYDGEIPELGKDSCKGLLFAYMESVVAWPPNIDVVDLSLL